MSISHANGYEPFKPCSVAIPCTNATPWARGFLAGPALHRIFVSMDITYVPALRYIEQAMGAEREVYATIRGEQLGDILEGS